MVSTLKDDDIDLPTFHYLWGQEAEEVYWVRHSSDA